MPDNIFVFGDIRLVALFLQEILIISTFFKTYIDIFKSILEPKVYRSPGACFILYYIV